MYLIIYGGLFLAVILLLPRGIIPSVQDLLERWRTRASVQERADDEAAESRDVVKAAGAR